MDGATDIYAVPLGDIVKEEGMEERLAGMLRAIVSDAEMIPDPRMDGATDIYAVPLGDIEDARELLMERRMLQLHPRG